MPCEQRPLCPVEKGVAGPLGGGVEEDRWKRERRGGDGCKCSKMGPFLRSPLLSPPQPSAVPTKIHSVLGMSGVSLKIGEKVKSFIWINRK